jgi:hypothetical protein
MRNTAALSESVSVIYLDTIKHLFCDTFFLHLYLFPLGFKRKIKLFNKGQSDVIKHYVKPYAERREERLKRYDDDEEDDDDQHSSEMMMMIMTIVMRIL